MVKITFVTPHQGTTSGGVYAIQQYASLLSRRHEISLGVVRGDLRAVPGCEVVPLESAPPADVVVFPADMGGISLPKGVPVCYLQGFGTPNNPVVTENLTNGHAVIASATWLAERARSAGSLVFHVPYGLDRAVFYPGPPAEEREPSVLMMTHGADWKGTDDGLESLQKVRSMEPGVRIGLFGTYEPDFPAEFHPAPDRERVADLMRKYQVFVCPSWEEGFGMPGLEAMACGALLATTDTKGSRDYAVDGESAIVVPPRRPERLADAIRTLLVDPEARAAVGAGAIRMTNSQLDWPESAARFEASLFEIIA